MIFANDANRIKKMLSKVLKAKEKKKIMLNMLFLRKDIEDL